MVPIIEGIGKKAGAPNPKGGGAAVAPNGGGGCIPLLCQGCWENRDGPEAKGLSDFSDVAAAMNMFSLLDLFLLLVFLLLLSELLVFDVPFCKAGSSCFVACLSCLVSI